MIAALRQPAHTEPEAPIVVGAPVRHRCHDDRIGVVEREATDATGRPIWVVRWGQGATLHTTAELELVRTSLADYTRAELEGELARRGRWLVDHDVQLLLRAYGALSKAAQQLGNKHPDNAEFCAVLDELDLRIEGGDRG